MLGALLDASGIAWALIGGHAVNAWLEPRATADIDVTIAADVAAEWELRRLPEAEGLTATPVTGATLPSGPDFVRFVSADGQVVLELQAAKTELRQSLLRRAVRHGAVSVATPEDLLVLKLIAFRAKDRADIAGLVALPAIDWDYVVAQAGAWGVTERLDRARSAFGG